MGKQVHKLLSKDIEAGTGVCANCGNVKLKNKGGVWRCHIGYSSQRGAWDWRKSIGWGHQLTTAKCNELTKAAGKCEICSSTTLRLVVDHCHETLKLRGVLCVKCNWGLGHFRDDPERLKAAIEYLKKPTALKV